MEDDKIIALYWARKEEAISETDRKYGSYCRSISFRILNDKEDSEECVNDTWLHTWNAIPPGKPEFLAGFLGKIVRNLSISKYRAGHAQKRGSGETQALLDELEECIPSGKSVEDEIEGRETAILRLFIFCSSPHGQEATICSNSTQIWWIKKTTET